MCSLMSALLEKFDKFLGGSTPRPTFSVRTEWDRLRDGAMTPQERDEIDAIFARQIDAM